jgi:hypothetical protein
LLARSRISLGFIARQPPALLRSPEMLYSANPSLPQGPVPRLLRSESVRIFHVRTACKTNTDIVHQRQGTPLEASLSHQATKITQIAGAYCKYYADCGGKFVFDAHTRSGDGNYIGNEVVPRVGGVYCELEAEATQLLETAQTLDANPASLVKRGTAELAHAFYGSTNTMGENRLNVRAFNAPGDTIVCHGKDYTYCHENRINAITQCANFDPNHTGPASLKQYQGAFCKYFGDFGCGNDDSPLIVDSTEVTVEIPRLGTEDRNRLKSVKCETHAW